VVGGACCCLPIRNLILQFFCDVRCQYGYRLVRPSPFSPAICQAVNECQEMENPCNGGRCIDATSGYVCECVSGRGGPTCAERRAHQVAAAYIKTGALLIIVACIILLLCKYSSFIPRVV
jgi:EGF-like domain